MTNRTKTRINADGEVVRASDDELTSSSTVLRSGNTLDVFGFNLEWRQLLIVLGVLSLMIGLQGSEYTRNFVLRYLNAGILNRFSFLNAVLFSLFPSICIPGCSGPVYTMESTCIASEDQHQ